MNELHPIREDELDAYALGVLEPVEEQVIENHVATCAACTQKLAESRGRIGLLALAADPAIPPAHVKQRLMDRIHSENRVASVAEQPTASRSFGWARVWATAAVAFAVVSVILWNSNLSLRTQLTMLQALASQQIDDLNRYRAVATLATGRETVAVSLAPPGSKSPAGHVLYNPQQGALLYSGTLPRLTADKAYELWLIPQTGNPIPAGVFNAQTSGEASVVLPRIPAGVAYKAFAITVEPAGGRPQPTGQMAQVSL